MAASAWQFYNSLRDKIGDASIDLSGGNFKVALCQSASNFATKTLTAYSELTSEVASGNGYTLGGAQLSATTWNQGTTTVEWAFDATAKIWTASGGSIANIKGAVIYQSGGVLMCYSTLTSAQFTVTDTNTLTITPAATGLFTLT